MNVSIKKAQEANINHKEIKEMIKLRKEAINKIDPRRGSPERWELINEIGALEQGIKLLGFIKKLDKDNAQEIKEIAKKYAKSIKKAIKKYAKGVNCDLTTK